ncbi:MAG: DNA recombination protein RmuC [Ilumatobacteraceae bacterium]
MEIVLMLVVAGLAAAVAWLLATRRPVSTAAPVTDEAVTRAVALAVAEANERAVRDRDQAVRAAVEQVVTMGREQLGGREEVIDRRLGEVQHGVQADLQRLTDLVGQLGVTTAERFGQVDRSLHVHAEITNVLADTTRSLREALASSNVRGQWGERMAEDVLRLAGFEPGVNYVRAATVAGEGTGIPDFTFLLPKGHVLFMDVKFPMSAYLRYLEAGTDAERSAHRAAFVRDVRARVRELAKREYSRVDERPAVDNVLLFVPNETLAAFIHESDPTLVDEALRQQVVICSPLTLYAFLGVIRQAFDNFVIEQTSREILGLLGTFGQQWRKYTDSVDKVRRQLDTVSRSFDELATTRRRALERPLTAIDDLRRRQPLPGAIGLLDDDVGAAPVAGVHELGA